MPCVYMIVSFYANTLARLFVNIALINVIEYEILDPIYFSEIKIRVRELLIIHPPYNKPFQPELPDAFIEILIEERSNLEV